MSRALLPLALLAALSVSVSTSCMPTASFTCSSDDDCASGFVCVTESGECVRLLVADSGVPDRPDAGAADAGFDAGVTDGGFDAGATDGGHDAGVADAGADGGVEEAGFDAGAADAGAAAAGYDGGLDAGYDAGYDAGWDAGYDGGAADAGPPVLLIEDVSGPAVPTADHALACSGTEVFWYDGVQGELHRSAAPSTSVWLQEDSATSILGTDGDATGPGLMEGGHAAWLPSLSSLVIGRWRDPALSNNVYEQARFARFDDANDSWSLITDTTFVQMDTGFTVAGDYLYGVQKAGGNVWRVRVSSLLSGALEWSSLALSFPQHDDQTWMSPAAKLAAHVDGRVYGLKNDRLPADEVHDLAALLYSFDPAAWAGDADVRVEVELPWTVGDGAAIVSVPAGWAGAPSGGLFVIAGESPSDGEGDGTFSTRAGLWDGERFWPVTLPAAVGKGTAACLLGDSIYVSRGEASQTSLMWRIRPSP